MRVLLAGATGYIGQAVLRELVAQGHEVVALVRPGRRLFLALSDERLNQTPDELSDGVLDINVGAPVSITIPTAVPSDVLVTAVPALPAVSRKAIL